MKKKYFFIYSLQKWLLRISSVFGMINLKKNYWSGHDGVAYNCLGQLWCLSWNKSTKERKSRFLSSSQKNAGIAGLKLLLNSLSATSWRPDQISAAFPRRKKSTSLIFLRKKVFMAGYFFSLLESPLIFTWWNTTGWRLQSERFFFKSVEFKKSLRFF